MPYKLVADMTPEEREEARIKRAEYRKKYTQSEKGKAAIKRKNQKYWEKNREKWRPRLAELGRIARARNPKKSSEYSKQYRKRNPEKAKAASDKKDRRRSWREAPNKRAVELLKDLSGRTPNYIYREDIVATAALYVMEGSRVYDALKKATKAVLRDESFVQFNAVPVEDCFWLCDGDEGDLGVDDLDQEGHPLADAYHYGPPTHPLFFRADANWRGVGGPLWPHAERYQRSAEMLRAALAPAPSITARGRDA